MKEMNELQCKILFNNALNLQLKMKKKEKKHTEKGQ